MLNFIPQKYCVSMFIETLEQYFFSFRTIVMKINNFIQQERKISTQIIIIKAFQMNGFKNTLYRKN